MSRLGQIIGRFWIYVLLVAAGYAIGAGVGSPPAADAEVRRSTMPESFKSGGARSEIVLKGIAATLEKMDTRLANLEKSAAELVVLQKQHR